ncbi:MAG: hypothetical protein M1822_002585 [Bathelium mastoideum]|nr:MAG: hypothetical protein M1822_002585 [Bathelium mastoideum]
MFDRGQFLNVLMVKATTIRESNLRFARESKQNEGLVCVFAGATSGIGGSTLETLVRIHSKPTCYVIGRSQHRFTSQRASLANANPGCKIVFLEARFSLLSDVDAACKRITVVEEKIDYLFMSPGVIPLNGPEYTEEGLELCFAITYYSRMRLLFNLLPLLRQSSHPRILSVLNGGKEVSIRGDDLELQRNWSPFAVVRHSTTMTSLTFEYLAQQEKDMTFVHVNPGWVPTDNFARLTAPVESSMAWKVFVGALKSVVAILAHLFGTSLEESGERQLFHLTNDGFGLGAWRVGYLSDPAPSNRVLAEYIEKGWPEKVWDHTIHVFDRVSAAEFRQLPGEN